MELGQTPILMHHFKVKAFLLCFDIPAIYHHLIPLWKDRIEPYIKMDARKARDVISVFLQEFYIVLECRQFDYHPSKINHSTLTNKTLQNLRVKMLNDLIANI